MSKAKSYLPEGYQILTPYLIVKDAKSAIEYYKKALGAAAAAFGSH